MIEAKAFFGPEVEGFEPYRRTIKRDSLSWAEKVNSPFSE
jgi:hypothetical protein